MYSRWPVRTSTGRAEGPDSGGTGPGPQWINPVAVPAGPMTRRRREHRPYAGDRRERTIRHRSGPVEERDAMRWYMPGMMRSGFMFTALSSVLMWVLIIGVIVAVGMF